MDPSDLSTPASPAKPVFACIRCSERKVKCDRKNPCETCTKHGVQCVFRPPKTSRKRRNVIKYRAIDERLSRYEALLRQHGINMEGGNSSQPVKVSGANDNTDAEAHVESSRENFVESQEGHESQSNIPKPTSGAQKTFFKPRLIQGQSGTKFVDNNLWFRVAEEIHNGEDASDEDDSTEETDHSGASQLNSSHILGHKAYKISHPPAHVIFQLWQTFIENVDPMLKMVHVPTLNVAIEKAAPNMSAVPKGFEALMFAIYAAAVLSVTNEECSSMFGESREILLFRYIKATKAALLRANFMSSTSIVMLQALMIHILAIRNIEEPRSVWALTGVALRVAEMMGMRVDGALLGLSPFETEIRRRIWWQIRMHDFRAAELAGQAKFKDVDTDETSPKRPGNIEDADLYPSMTQPAEESDRPTEMLWCVFRSELASFATTQKLKMQKLGKPFLTSEEYPAMDDLKIKDDFLQQLQDLIETKYLRYCDPTHPLQLLTLVGARASFSLMKFISHHPRRWTGDDQVPASEREMIWQSTLQLLEHYHMMQSNPQLKRFAWNVPYFIQWQAVIHVLDTLRAQPLHDDAFKAWRLINAMYEQNLEMLLNIKRPVFAAVGNLCLKAFAARDTAFRQRNVTVSDPPSYIIKLREQREAAKARKEAIHARRNASEPTSLSIDTQSHWSATTPRSEDTLVENIQSQNTTIHSTVGLAQDLTHIGDDAFWLNDALDVSAVTGRAAETMDVDIDTILTQDLWPNDVQQQTIDWGQWDAWLGAGPNIGSKST